MIVATAPEEQQPAFLAACVVFRVLYNWLPLLVAAPLYLLFERRVRRQAAANGLAAPNDAPAEQPGSKAVVAGSPDAD